MRMTTVGVIGGCVLGAAGLVLITSCASNGTSDDDGDANRFSIASDPEIEYETIAIGSFHYHWNWCRKCHYSSGASGEKARGPSLIDDEWLHCDGSIEGIMEIIREGVPESQIKTPKYTEMMPPASMMNFTEDHVRAIASYLWVLNQAPMQESVEP